MKVSRPFVGFGWRLLALAVVAAATASCVRHVIAPVPVRSPVDPAEFRAALTPFVTSGSTGEEGSGAYTHWWINAPQATITVRADRAATLQLSATFIAPPCRSQVHVRTSIGTTSGPELRPGAAGQRLSIPIKFAAHEIRQVKLSIDTPSCKVKGDSRSLYVGIVSLTVAPR